MLCRLLPCNSVLPVILGGLLSYSPAASPNTRARSSARAASSSSVGLWDAGIPRGSALSCLCCSSHTGSGGDSRHDSGGGGSDDSGRDGGDNDGDSYRDVVLLLGDSLDTESVLGQAMPKPWISHYTHCVFAFLFLSPHLSPRSLSHMHVCRDTIYLSFLGLL